MRHVTRDSVYIPGIKLIYDTRVNMAKRDLKYDFVSAIYALQLYVFYLNKGKGELHPVLLLPVLFTKEHIPQIPLILIKFYQFLFLRINIDTM